MSFSAENNPMNSPQFLGMNNEICTCGCKQVVRAGMWDNGQTRYACPECRKLKQPARATPTGMKKALRNKYSPMRKVIIDRVKAEEQAKQPTAT